MWLAAALVTAASPLALPTDEAGELATLQEIFLNASSIPDEPSHGAFGVCYVAFVGSHDRRYRGEKLLETAATQLRAAAEARGTRVAQCVVTDQPERPRPYVDLLLPLRTPLDAAPFVNVCDEYTRRFKRPCKLLFGYMAKAIAVARAPYSATLFVDTDTFVCDVAPLIATGRLLQKYDVLLHMPRTTQGWVNSGVLGVRRETAGPWATSWQREFTSLDDFGDQLHVLKVLPPMGTSSWTPTASSSSGAIGGRGKGAGGKGAGGKGRGKGKGKGGGDPSVARRKLAADGRRLSTVGDGAYRGSLAIGELPPELHLRVGSVADGAYVKLPALRGPAMLLHSKGLAALGSFTPHLAATYASQASPAQRPLLTLLGDGEPEAKKKGEHALYSPRALAGFCLAVNDGWAGRAKGTTRQLVLNANGTCTNCARLPKLVGGIGIIDGELGGSTYDCSQGSGDCGVVPAVWPIGSERGLPEWYVAHARKMALSAGVRGKLI